MSSEVRGRDWEGIALGVVGVVLTAVIIVLVVAMAVTLARRDDKPRLSREAVEGVECIVVRNGLGRPRAVDCNWETTSEGAK